MLLLKMKKLHYIQAKQLNWQEPHRYYHISLAADILWHKTLVGCGLILHRRKSRKWWRRWWFQVFRRNKISVKLSILLKWHPIGLKLHTPSLQMQF